MSKCEKCDGLGYVCVRCSEADKDCNCPYNGGKKPGVTACPECQPERYRPDTPKKKGGK